MQYFLIGKNGNRNMVKNNFQTATSVLLGILKSIILSELFEICFGVISFSNYISI